MKIQLIASKPVVNCIQPEKAEKVKKKKKLITGPPF